MAKNTKTSSFNLGWVFISNEERRKTAGVLAKLSGQEAVDELGIGRIRDYFSEKLFPGFSTAQKRVKYFILIPKAIINVLKSSNKPSTRRGVQDALNKEEWDFVEKFIKYDKTDEKKGIIGLRNYQNGKKGMNTYPSELYWSGLVTTGIVTNKQSSLSDVCTEVASYEKLKSDYDDDELQSISSLLHLDSDICNLDWNPNTIKLNRAEANYLFLLFTKGTNTSSSLTAYFLRKNKISNKDKDFFDIDIKDLEKFDRGLAKVYQNAVNFSNFIWGAYLAYNYLLTNDEQFLKKFNSWKKSKDSRFDIKKLNDIPNAEDAKKFVSDFQKYVKAANNELVFECVRKREAQKKPGKTKLDKKHKSKKPVHNFKLDYRFGVARAACNDIINGMK
jgi:hypothetical protein